MMGYNDALAVMAFIAAAIAYWAAVDASRQPFWGMLLHVPITTLFLAQNPLYSTPGDLAIFYIAVMAGLPLSLSWICVRRARHSEAEERLSLRGRIFCGLLSAAFIVLGVFLCASAPPAPW